MYLMNKVNILKEGNFIDYEVEFECKFVFQYFIDSIIYVNIKKRLFKLSESNKHYLRNLK